MSSSLRQWCANALSDRHISVFTLRCKGWFPGISDADLDELVSAALVALVVFARTGRPIENVEALLHTIARRAFSKLVARRDRSPDSFDSTEQRVDPAAPPDEPQTHFWDAVVSRCLADLPDPMRELITEHFYEGKTFREIDRDHGFPQSTAYRRIQAALNRLRSDSRISDPLTI